MEKYKQFSDFINTVSEKWFKSFFLGRLDELKNSLLDSNTEIIGDFKPDLSTLNKIFANTKVEIEGFKTLEEINEYISTNFSISDDKDGTMPSTIQTELVEAIKENPTNIHEKITELIIRMQVTTIVKNCHKALKLCDNLNGKLGSTTDFKDIDKEDVYYILNSDVAKIVNNLKNWSTQNPKQAENYENELKILMDEESSIQEKKDASDIVEHYFSTIIGNEIDDEDINDLAPDKINENSIILIFNKGITICDEMVAKIDLTHLVHEELN
ncbi:hypothetical protein SCHIN_v1c06390 [Spiroplasma chinense]|uniref:Uncharacterized protein n=1 Tax=Spiroplasma chinense TaxID=216932 RepID=A0A5B9Y554_9MOLU|nr:hypothetical protein [Spiroplasma chinense]QEH61836.1 hypothetical protein SCHIN_v1c06390 [Spiroplasma chinense]